MSDKMISISDLQKDLLSLDNYEDLSQLFKMFADPTRLKIFTLLSKNTLNVEELTQALNMTQSAVSHQLSSLRKLNLVRTEKVGRKVFYSLADDHVMQIFKQALDHVLESC